MKLCCSLLLHVSFDIRLSNTLLSWCRVIQISTVDERHTSSNLECWLANYSQFLRREMRAVPWYQADVLKNCTQIEQGPVTVSLEDSCDPVLIFSKAHEMCAHAKWIDMFAICHHVKLHYLVTIVPLLSSNRKAVLVTLSVCCSSFQTQMTLTHRMLRCISYFPSKTRLKSLYYYMNKILVFGLWPAAHVLVMSVQYWFPIDMKWFLAVTFRLHVLHRHTRGCIQKFPDWVDNEIYAYLGYCSLRSNTKD